MSEPTHTHYDPYGPPRMVPGTLLDCDNARAHDPKDSGVFAEGLFDPRLVPSVTGLAPAVEMLLLAAFMQRRDPQVRPVLTEASRTDAGYEVTITIRRGDDIGWHSERYAFEYSTGKVEQIIPNPHPGHEHWSAFFPNCGY